MLESYLLEVLGEKSLATWLASFTFIVIGVIVSLRLSALILLISLSGVSYLEITLVDL